MSRLCNEDDLAASPKADLERVSNIIFRPFPTVDHFRLTDEWISIRLQVEVVFMVDHRHHDHREVIQHHNQHWVRVRMRNIV